MRNFSLSAAARCLFFGVVAPLAASLAGAADFEFYGRSGDAIELNFGALPGTPTGASYSTLTLGGSFTGHTTLTSTDLQQGAFASDGRLWVFADPARNTAPLGDTDPASRGFQGRLEGSLNVNGVPMTFAVNVVPGHTGAGTGSVQQAGESDSSAPNRLNVAQQQHRLRYLGFRQNAFQLLPTVDGLFGTNTDAAVRTFQAAFISGTSVNATQNSVDGIVGPNTAGWLNAANAPTWDELVDPDPQSYPPAFSVSSMIGDFDILPSFDPGGGGRTGLTPQIERFGTSWSIELFTQGSALAKSRTGITQLMNGMSTLDGYDSSAFHSTHRAGMDIDIHVDYPSQVLGNGVVNAAEQGVIDTAVAYLDAGLAGEADTGRVARFITSNSDIRNGILAARPGTSVFLDTSNGHLNHLHIDAAPPARVTGLANLAGDFNLDDRVDLADYTAWRDGLDRVYTASDYSSWVFNFGTTRLGAAVAVPEPCAAALLLSGFMLRRRSS
ncbi:peptidoglycan-binding domain-containing protein [Botrimarina hoheduenensis]|uniref:Putative peptidoglycan binding domain protein n=1 Tax=Botrimarina hoheduenensis TaxID=2528000 RepID=A0A5C5W8Y9_9BACT|nr:peptidoglycan-binding domain-containing protein [Botrimarina hoheduenensis]TWT46733.1 putative peptidoglycan binding domain protein [Botrimarina hoheduenensis]